MVACDHNRTNAGTSAFYNRVLDLGTDGIDHTAKSHEAEIALKIVSFKACRYGVVCSLCTGKNTESLVCHFFVCLQNGRLVLLCHRNGLAVLEVVCTSADDNVGCALGVLDSAVIKLVNGRHHLSSRVEGGFSKARELFFQVVFFQIQLICPSNESCLGRLTRDVSVGVKLGVTAESHRHGKLFFVLSKVVNNGHLVLCQSTRLVGADDLCAAEGFHGGQTANDGVTLGHIGHAHGKNDGNDHRKSFGNSSNRQRNGNHKGRKNGIGKAEVARTDELNAEYDHADAKNEPSQDLGELIELSL